MLKSEVLDYYRKKAWKEGRTDCQRYVGEIVGVSQEAVSRWSKLIPERHAMKLQKLTRGRLRYDESDYR